MRILVGLVMGCASWSIIEYVMHRFRGHESDGTNLFAREHLRHHATPGYFTPTRTKLRLALPVLLAVFAVTSLVADWRFGLAFTFGLLLTYFGYETFHMHLHVRPPRTRYGRFVRKHHFFHHFHAPRTNHGVTTPVWDWLFGTLRKADRVRIPAAFAMSWLLTSDGALKPEYVADYVIVPKPDPNG